MNKRQLGSEKEKLAAEYLQERGYEIVACNYRCRQAEIDIIAKKEEYLIFIEVKYRKRSKHSIHLSNKCILTLVICSEQTNFKLFLLIR